MPLYFAYGSCMCPDDLSRTVESSFVNIARIRNYKLAFTRYSYGRSGGVADIVKSDGDYVEGVLMLVDNFDALDAREGHPTIYKRRKIRVYPNGHESYVYAYTYEVVRKERNEVQPSEDYCEIVRNGAYKYLSAEYQMKLEESFAKKRHRHKPIKRYRHAEEVSLYIPRTPAIELLEERERDSLFQQWFKERYKTDELF